MKRLKALILQIILFLSFAVGSATSQDGIFGLIEKGTEEAIQAAIQAGINQCRRKRLAFTLADALNTLSVLPSKVEGL